MADSKKPADQNLDQSDDLIAELARIVADDAKRASVSQSIEERAQKERSPQREERPSSFTSAFSGQQQDQGRQDRPAPEPSVPQRPEQSTPSTTPEAPATSANPPQSDQGADPFEFDFASSYRQDAEAKAKSSQEDFGAQVEKLVAEAQSEPQPEPVAPQSLSREERQSAEALKREVNAAAEVDEIANLISDADDTLAPQAPASTMESQPVEAEQLEPVEPQYDHESDALFADEPYMEPQEEQPQEPEYVAREEAPQPKPVENQPAKSDPLSEIERLIEDTASGSAGGSPHSYLQTPGDEGKSPTSKEDPSSAAEAAILAAMAAARPASDAAEPPKAQAPVGPAPEAAPTAAAGQTQSSAPYLHAESRDHMETEPVRKVKKRSNLPVYAGGLAALLLLGLGGATLWNFIGGGGATDGDVPLVTAQNTDVKQTPENAGETTDSPSVFSALEGQPEDTSSEQLVSRDDTDGASGEGVSRVITPSNSDDATGGLTNRKVKTVTVLADGTIVTGDEASAGAQQLPDIRPNVPEVTSTSDNETATSNDPIGDAIQSAENTGEAITDAAGSLADQAEQTVNDAADALTDDAQTGDVVADAPTPPERPQGLGTNQPLASAVLNNSAPATSDSNDQPLGLVPDSQPVTTPQTNSAPVNATTNQVSAPFYVQLASQRSPEAAQSTVTTVTRQFADALSGQTVGVNQVDLDDRGVFYRVLVPANSIEAANSICSNIKLSGGDCFVRNN
ncbi:SPOR domain-containing protein [Maritalea myrionectae]|uniref:SPOR domain-containing protein n=1 Tax=Maritalea myrionectae TaxID=454601 RepID=UPI000421D1B0|nr:SPOR domain-containing protein [Maritalea myrionectae]